MARILIVDDDKDLLYLMREYLSACGFQSELAASAAEARSCLEHSQFDAIISDFIMPGESGLDLLCHVSSRYPGLPFIMMSGAGTPMLKDKAIKMGSMEYIAKPFEFRELVVTLERILGLSNQDAQALAVTG